MPVTGEDPRFSVFTWIPTGRALWAERAVPLRPKAFDVLLHLARNRNRVVSKDELMEAIWPNVFVTENSLVQCISDIRAALGEDGPAILKTVARRGYTFAAPVLEAEPMAEEAAPDETRPPPPASR